MEDRDLGDLSQPFEVRVLLPTHEDRPEPLLEDYEIPTSINQIKDLMMSGNAIGNLRSSIRQLVLPDMMEAISKEVKTLSDLNRLANKRYSVTFSVCWEALRYINEEFDPGQAFDPVLTVSGNAMDSYATSCAGTGPRLVLPCWQPFKVKCK